MTIILFFVPPKFCISIVFNFSWDLRQIETNAYAKFWRDRKEYYGKFENGLLETSDTNPNWVDTYIIYHFKEAKHWKSFPRRGPWRGKMGTRISLFLHWENGIWVTGTRIWVMPLGLGVPYTKLGIRNMSIYSISTEIYSLQSRWIKIVLHWKEAIWLVIRFFSLVKNIVRPIRILIRFFFTSEKNGIDFPAIAVLFLSTRLNGSYKLKTARVYFKTVQAKTTKFGNFSQNLNGNSLTLVPHVHQLWRFHGNDMFFKFLIFLFFNSKINPLE